MITCVQCGNKGIETQIFCSEHCKIKMRNRQLRYLNFSVQEILLMDLKRSTFYK